MLQIARKSVKESLKSNNETMYISRRNTLSLIYNQFYSVITYKL